LLAVIWNWNCAEINTSFPLQPSLSKWGSNLQ